MATIGERLRAMREARGWSQDKLGERLGRNQRWISERERGSVGTTVDEAIEIADALGFAAELVAVPRVTGDQLTLLEQLGALDPNSVDLAVRLLGAWQHLDENTRRMVSGMVMLAEEAAENREARG